MFWKEHIIEKIHCIPLLDISVNNYNSNYKHSFSKITSSLGQNSYAVLNNIVSWQFAWNYIDGFENGLMLGGYANIFLNEYKTAKKVGLNPVGAINIVDNSSKTEDYININGIQKKDEFQIENFKFPYSQINTHIIPFDVNLNGYHVCFVKTNDDWKLAMLDSNGLNWTSTKLISIPQYLNFLLNSAGAIEARFNLFFAHTIDEAYLFIPKVLKW